MTDHRWEHTLVVEANLGFTQPPRPYSLFAPTPLAVSLTGMICSLSIEHGPGRKIKLGRKWLLRARVKAEDVERQVDELD